MWTRIRTNLSLTKDISMWGRNLLTGPWCNFRVRGFPNAAFLSLFVVFFRFFFLGFGLNLGSGEQRKCQPSEYVSNKKCLLFGAEWKLRERVCFPTGFYQTARLALASQIWRFHRKFGDLCSIHSRSVLLLSWELFCKHKNSICHFVLK